MNPIRIFKEQYPELLQNIEKPPKFLDLVGSLPDPESKFLCIIGARRYSSYGDEVCKKLIQGLRGYPIVIVSGLALGIDSIAHRYALEAGLKTIAFPGSGLSDYSLYPSSHLSLAHKIVSSGGALLSPFKPEQEATLWTFPVRNQLMAASCHATLIIESRQKSGTMITAKAALNFGREVLIVPGSIFSDLSYGPLTLLEDGATPVSSSADILRVLGFEYAPKPDVQKINFEKIGSLSAVAQKIIRLLQVSSLNSSELIEQVSLSAPEFNILISELELEDLVHSRNGKYVLGPS